MANFEVLDQVDEDNLHAKRLLNIEEKPFKRVSKRLLAPTNPIQVYLSRKTTAKRSYDTGEDDDTESDTDLILGTADEENVAFLKTLARFRHDCILDFAAFDSSIARIQFLRSANERERARYAAEKQEIQNKAEYVRDNTANLRTQLDSAKKTMEIRKGYDVLAEKVMKDEKTSKTRDELRVASEKLQNEIEELEREGLELQTAWSDRRQQLSQVIIETNKLRRIIRDEKEPESEENALKDDGEEGDHEREDDDGMMGVRDRDGGSHMGTPRPPDDAPTPLPGVHESGGMTPRSAVGEGDMSSPRYSSTANDPKMISTPQDHITDNGDASGIPTVKILEVVEKSVDDSMDTS